MAFPLESREQSLMHGATLTSAQDVEDEVSSYFSTHFKGRHAVAAAASGPGTLVSPSLLPLAHFPTFLNGLPIFPKKKETP
jgi:hypothetical protein